MEAGASVMALGLSIPNCPRPHGNSSRLWLGWAKQRVGEKLGSRATYGEGTQNLLCAILAGAVLVGLAANTFFGLCWLDPAIAVVIAVICVRVRQKAWRGEACGCVTCS
jgi:hypothetical protein